MTTRIDGETWPTRERAWVEVNAGALSRNLARVASSVGPSVSLIPMVKANAYGLGVREAVAAFRSAAYGYGVAAVQEGVELRTLGVADPVMLYSPVPADALERAARAGLVPLISDLEGLAALRAVARQMGDVLPFQVEVDTGMGRSGFPLESVADWWTSVRDAAASDVRLAGIFTHLHSADAPDLESSRAQVDRFQRFLRHADGIGDDVLVHAANSAGAVRLPAGFATAVRPGIFLYGGSVGDPHIQPEVVVNVRARIGLVRSVAPGTTLGYGATYAARTAERWATVGIGYGDGLPRALGNVGRGIVHGRTVPIIGRISMDMTVVDVSGAGDVSVGDIVTFVGRDGGATLPLDEVADLAGTISYEILTGLTPRLPRIWMES